MTILATGLVAEEITTAGLESLRDEWSALCDRRPDTTPFQRPEWLLPWSRAFPPHEPWILTVRSEGRLAGLTPLFRWRNSSERTVSPFGAGLSDYVDAVIDPEAEGPVLEAVFSWLEDRRGEWDVCDFEQLRPSSPLLRAPAPARWAEEVVPSTPCQVVDLPETFEGLHGQVSTRLLSNLRAYNRRLAKLGTVEIQAADSGDTESREEILDTIIRLHTARWQSRGEAGMMADPKVRTFHHEVAAGFQARGGLILNALRLDGQCLAAIYGFQEKDRTYLYTQGFDPEHAKLSPGVVIVGAAVEETIQRGARACDFLRGREPYKEHWRPREAPTFRRRLRCLQSAA
jgi:CelD/BcsL family acetyltransferase involved in cellulose biosynthesis